MDVSFAIMAHESRKKWFPYVRETLGDVPILVDKGKKGDPENIGIWQNCRRSWLAYDPKAEFHFVLQDDVVLTSNFIDKVQNLTKNGDYMYNLYLGNRARFREPVKKARREGRDHLIFKSIHHEIALGMRTEKIKEMIEFCDAQNPELDTVINKYVHHKKMRVYCPVPSLVDHRNDESLHKHNRSFKANRTAIWFVL